jgi:hypothetical protein
MTAVVCVVLDSGLGRDVLIMRQGACRGEQLGRSCKGCLRCVVTVRVVAKHTPCLQGTVRCMPAAAALCVALVGVETTRMYKSRCLPAYCLL